MRTLTLTRETRRWVYGGLIGLVGVVLLLVWLNFYAWVARTWYTYTNWKVLWDGIRMIWSGGNPYLTDIGFYNPPWIAILLSPLALLPPALGAQINTMLAFGVYALFAWRAQNQTGGRLSKFSVVAALLSLPVLMTLMYSNIEWLVVAGLLLPPRCGLLLVLVKPQVGAGIAVYWLFDAYRQGGWRRCLETLLPSALVLGLSLVLYGAWPLHTAQAASLPWNHSLFPYSIPFGLGLLVAAIRRRRVGWALAAGPLLSPYVAAASYSALVLGLLPDLTPTLLASLVTWVYFVWRLMGGYGI